MFPRISSLLFSALSVISAQASTITIADLPATIQSCSTCTVNLSGIDVTMASGGDMSLFMFSHARVSGGPIAQDWLVRYALGPSSVQTTIPSYGNAQFAGNLWMSVQSTYSSTDATTHPFVLYLDKISPLPTDLNFAPGSDISLSMPVADLLAGSSYYSAGRTMPPIQEYSYGNLTGTLPIVPADWGAYAGAQLNLVGLTFINAGSSIMFDDINPYDSRSLVYTQRSGWNDTSLNNKGDKTQVFDIRPVPLPGALWLFGSGLLGLSTVLRRNKCQN